MKLRNYSQITTDFQVWILCIVIKFHSTCYYYYYRYYYYYYYYLALRSNVTHTLIFDETENIPQRSWTWQCGSISQVPSVECIVLVILTAVLQCRCHHHPVLQLWTSGAEADTGTIQATTTTTTATESASPGCKLQQADSRVPGLTCILTKDGITQDTMKLSTTFNCFLHQMVQHGFSSLRRID